jgi:hypothetical protein
MLTVWDTLPHHWLYCRHSVGHTTAPLVVLPSPTRCCCRAGKKSKEEAERAAVEEEALNKVTVELEAGALQNSVTWGWW